MKKLWHRIEHFLGWNKGRVETFYDPDGVLMVGFRCTCGELQSVDRCISFTVDKDGKEIH